MNNMFDITGKVAVVTGGSGVWNNGSGLIETQVGSSNLRWEKSKKYNLGIDMRFFHERFDMTIDFFKDYRSGIYQRRASVPDEVGLPSLPWANVGEMKSWGADGHISYTQPLGDNDKYLVVRANYTQSMNEITNFEEAIQRYPYQTQVGYQSGINRGLIALGLFKDYDDIRNSPKQEFGTVQPGDIKYKDVNGDGVVNDGDRVAIGATTRPNMIYGFGISGTWKGFDLNVHFQGAGKSSFFIDGPTVYAFSSGEWGNVLKDVAESDRWISADISGNPATENPNAEYPRLSFGGNSNNYRASTFWLRDGSYLRLKTLEFGYTLPKQIVNKIMFNNIRVFFRGSNILTFSKFKLWDPELHSSTGTEYPLSRSLTFGLTVNI